MALDLKQFQRGWFTVDAVQLTRENLPEVFEWADSKPFFGPAPEGLPCLTTGLTVFETTGRNKAEFGDWIYRTPAGSFKTRPSGEFLLLFTPVAATSSPCPECGFKRWDADNLTPGDSVCVCASPFGEEDK